MNRSHKFANIILGSAVLVCLVALIYATFLSVNSPDVLKKYQLASLAGVVLFGLAFKLPEGAKVNFALTITSMGVALYLLEIILFLAGLTPVSPEAQRISRAEQRRIPFDTRSKRQVIMDLRRQGHDAYSSVYPTTFVESNGLPIGEDTIYPLAGISEKLTVYCNESGEWSLFESDEHGFNNPAHVASLWSETDGKQAVDIVMVGDSFTDGACVKPGEEIAGQLRQSGRTVLNLGYGGNGPLLELATLKEYSESFKPHIVLWVYYEGNDLTNLLREKESSLLLKYLDKDFGQALLKRQSEIDGVLIDYVRAEEVKAEVEDAETEIKEARRKVSTSNWASIVKLFTLRSLLNQSDDSIDSAQALPLFREVLAEAKARSEVWGGTLYFVYIPDWSRYKGSLRQDNFYRNEVLAIVEEEQIPLIDFHQVLSTHPDPLALFPYRAYSHYAAEGYQLVAQQIETYLESGPDE